MEVAQEVIKTLLVSGKNYRDISTELKSLYPDIKRGLSERSVRRYVTKHNLRHVCETEKRTLIEDSVREVGGSYGRKMLKGYLLSKGVATSERQLKRILPVVSPQWHAARQKCSHERSNPRIYIANYFGHKLHVDQNEKLVHYGVTYVLARDGFSGKIVGTSIMSLKNNEVIYEDVLRKCLLEYGLWDEVRVDHGKEFYLMLYIQEQLRKEGRGDPHIAPYLQTSSTYNHIIERIWVEVNKRVTYPIKAVIVLMDDERAINMENRTDKYCVSIVLRRVCAVGLLRMVNAWNSHTIPRKGNPNVLQLENNQINPIVPSDIPTAADAVSAYRGQGGTLTDPSDFGEDPLHSHPILSQQRDQEWSINCMTLDDIYTELMCGNKQPLQDAILNFIQITINLSPLDYNSTSSDDDFTDGELA